MNRFVVSFVLLVLSPQSFAEELLPPKDLLKQPGTASQIVTVVEPHESDSSHRTDVTYRAVSANKVLEQLFGPEWQSTDNDVVFSATDGYQYAANAGRFLQYKAYLAYARADSRPFTVVNSEGQTTELGPYYLIWDNIDAAALVRQGAYGWPYQVERVEIRPMSAYARILPGNASAQARDGFELVKEYCLICHQIAGIGGQKSPADLRQLLCSLNHSKREEVIDAPGVALKAGGMPPLDPQLQGEGRRQTIDLIMAYLQTVQPEGQVCQPDLPHPASVR